MADDDIIDQLFHRCALAAGFVAAGEGRLHDSEYVRRLAYGMYEDALAEKNGRPRHPGSMAA
jgi:hypothetical protein